jgi:predicted transcriptional regulator
MGRRNLTVQLDDDVVTKARILAARRLTSVSRLVADEIRRLVEEDEHYESARRSALVRLASPAGLGGPPYAARQDLHERG